LRAEPSTQNKHKRLLTFTTGSTRYIYIFALLSC